MPAVSDIKKIKLPSGHETIVDADVYDRVGLLKWYRATVGYAVTGLKVDGEHRMLSLHRYIMQPPCGFVVDHLNENKLDNRRSNLRICTRQVNDHGKRRKNKRSGNFTGVSLHHRTGLWRARIFTNKKESHLGLFDSMEDAARAYDFEAVRRYGVHAKTNFPQSLASQPVATKSPCNAHNL